MDNAVGMLREHQLKTRRPYRLSRTMTITLIGIAIGLFAIAMQDVSPYTAAEIRRKSDEINERAGVRVPHQFNDAGIQKVVGDIVGRVERNEELSLQDSAKYRIAYQAAIFQMQSRLRRFDRNLTVLADVEMDRANNVGGIGIEGSHDHHDASVRSNLRDLTTDLAALQRSRSPVRLRYAILSYKNISDVLSHLATVPHTKSTPYSPPVGSLSDIERLGEQSLRSFKDAQFASVNSNEYWSALFRALDEFDRLAMAVQSIVNERLTLVERKLAGRWGSVQTLGPLLTAGSEPRRRRPAIE